MDREALDSSDGARVRASVGAAGCTAARVRASVVSAILAAILDPMPLVAAVESAGPRALATPLQDAAPAPPKLVRRALLVGVGDYPIENDWPRLTGPKLDVEALDAALVSRAGFAPGDVTVLLDRDATRAAILSGFQSMIDRSQHGDLLLFYFAGHGSRLPDDNGDELDGWDETLVPYDAVAGGGKHNDIRDEEIGELIRRANEKTDQVVLIFDCCSSGTNTRAGNGVPRYLAPQKRGLDAAVLKEEKRAVAVKEGSGYVPPRMSFVSLAACRAQESAYELSVAGEAGASPRTRGVFSTCLVDALLEIDPDLSYADWMTDTRARVRRQAVDQTPIIEGGLASYRLFQPLAAGRAKRCELARTDRGELVLAAGRLDGFEAGAVLSVCKKTALRDASEARVARIRLTTVGSMSSRAEWIDAAPPDDAETRWSAFLLEHARAREPLRVALRGDGPDVNEWSRFIAESPLLAPATSEDCTLVLAWDDRERAPDGRWVLCTGDGVPTPLSADPRSTSERDALSANLTRLALAHQAARLLTTDPMPALAIETRLEWLHEDGTVGAPIEPDASGKLLVPPGKDFVVTAHNRSAHAVYATVVVISPDGEICLMQPPTVDDRIPPGDSSSRGCALTVPPALESFYAAAPVQLFVVVTVDHHELYALEQEPVGVVSRGAVSKKPAIEKTLAGDTWTSTAFDLWVDLRKH